MRQLEMLAEILASTKVGRGHVRMVAEIVIADDELTQALLDYGEPTDESWFAALEDLEDSIEDYQRAWSQLRSIQGIISAGRLTTEGKCALDRLAAAMGRTIAVYGAVVGRLRGSAA